MEQHRWEQFAEKKKMTQTCTWIFNWHLSRFFQAIGTMSCLGMWFPRSTMFTDMFSGWWVFIFFPTRPFSFTHPPFPTVLCVSLTSRVLLWKIIVKPEPQNLQKNWKQECCYVMCEVSFTFLLLFLSPPPKTSFSYSSYVPRSHSHVPRFRLPASRPLLSP